MNIRLVSKNEEAVPGSRAKIYRDLVNEKIRARYDISEELAILRQRDSNPEKFNEYNEFAERCKAEAATEVGI